MKLIDMINNIVDKNEFNITNDIENNRIIVSQKGLLGDFKIIEIKEFDGEIHLAFYNTIEKDEDYINKIKKLINLL